MNAPRLKWREADGRVQEYLIVSPEIVIGRAGGADLVLTGQHVSRRHALLRAEASGYEIQDLESRYGTFVNGERVQHQTLRHGDRIIFGKGDEYYFFIDASEARPEMDTTRVVQKSLHDLGRVLPSGASDLEKILCVLNFQQQWNEVFTPENGLYQILESALKISGAERAFIMTRKFDGFGYAAGMDGDQRRLPETQFRASQRIVRDVAANRQPVFMVEGIQGDYKQQESIVAMNLRAIACLPLMGIPVNGESAEVLGILYLDSTKPMHSLSGLDERILTKLAVEAGNVLERVELMKSIEQRKSLERDLALAQEAQRSLLPREIPQLPHLRLSGFSRPTRYVGGDFYDFQLTQSGNLTLVLADISGKGVAASLLSSMILGCLQLRLQDGDAPDHALNRLNKFIHAKASGRFATMFLCALGPDCTGRYISAGHNPSYLYRAGSRTIEELPSTSLVLGAFDFVSYESVPVEIRPGDVLMVYSDGLTEAENSAGEMFGEDRVKDIVQKEAPKGAEALQQALISAIGDFTRGHDQTDDITIVIAERP